MVRVLIFHLGFYFSGGGEKLVLEEIKGLQKAGFEVECFAPIVDRKRCFPDIIKNNSIYPILPQLPNWFPKGYTIQLLVTCALFPLISFRFRKYDVVFAANQPGPYYAFWLKKFYKIPYIAYLAQPLRLLHPRKVDKETGLFIRERLEVLPYIVNFFRPIFDWADRQGMNNADKVLVNGKYAKMMIEKVYKMKCESCPAGSHPETKTLSFNRRKKGLVKVNGNKINKAFILLTNRHFPQKRFEYAISSLPAILEKIPVQLVITGEEMEYTSFLNKFVKQMGLEKNVFFTGLVAERKLRELYKNALIYVYTAPEEDFGMGIIEAMAAGTPVVAWNSAGPKYIMEGNIGGLLAEPYKIGDYAAKILRLATEKELFRKKSIQAHSLVIKSYSYKIHNQKLAKEIRKLL